MELDDQSKKAVQELGDAINDAIEKSLRVAESIESLRALGYEPNLGIKLEIGLMQLVRDENHHAELGEEDDAELDMQLTDEDLRELRKMKISLE